MPRKAGKAASRKARQRSVKRASRPASAYSSAAPNGPSAEADVDVVPPVGTPDAREAASLRPPRRTPSTTTQVGSTLTSSERAEYHYVERDLRNIAILTVAMAVLLFVAWAAFSAMGLVG
jgi:hypothetical protein